MVKSVLKLLTVLCASCAALEGGTCGREGCDEAALVQKVMTVVPKKLSPEEAKTQLQEVVNNLVEPIQGLIDEMDATVKETLDKSAKLSEGVNIQGMKLVSVEGDKTAEQASRFVTLAMKQKHIISPTENLEVYVKSMEEIIPKIQKAKHVEKAVGKAQKTMQLFFDNEKKQIGDMATMQGDEIMKDKQQNLFGTLFEVRSSQGLVELWVQKLDSETSSLDQKITEALEQKHDDPEALRKTVLGDLEAFHSLLTDLHTTYNTQLDDAKTKLMTEIGATADVWSGPEYMEKVKARREPAEAFMHKQIADMTAERVGIQTQKLPAHWESFKTNFRATLKAVEQQAQEDKFSVARSDEVDKFFSDSMKSTLTFGGFTGVLQKMAWDHVTATKDALFNDTPLEGKKLDEVTKVVKLQSALSELNFVTDVANKWKDTQGRINNLQSDFNTQTRELEDILPNPNKKAEE